jgi:hypothetical protein
MEGDLMKMAGDNRPMEHNQRSDQRESQTIAEQRLSDLMGVDRSVLRGQRRHLPEGSWFRVGNAVVWSMEAATAFLCELGMERVLPSLEAELNGEAEAADGPAGQEQVRVVRIPRNPKLLLCEDSRGMPCRVRVRTNEKFVAGMMVPADFGAASGADRMGTIACRLPRLRGRLPGNQESGVRSQGSGGGR